MFRRALKKISPFLGSPSTADLPDFIYEALPDSSKYLRLVEVFPEKNVPDQPRKPTKVCCRISHVPLSDGPIYQALSYTVSIFQFLNSFYAALGAFNYLQCTLRAL